MDGDVELTGAMQGRDVRSNRMATKDVSVVLTHLLPPPSIRAGNMIRNFISEVPITHF